MSKNNLTIETKTKSVSPALPGLIRTISTYKIDGLILLSVFLIVYGFISHYYPAPSGTYDTPNYIHCATTMENGGYRPFGYSWFLNFVHQYDQTSAAVFDFQYVFFIVSSLYLFFAILLVFPAITIFQRALLILAFCLSPYMFYLHNYLMSDSIFVSLTNIWLASLICFACNKNLFTLGVHMISIFLAIEVRYAAMYYPVFSVVVILFTFKRSFLSLLAVIPLVITFMIHSKTVRQIQKMSGVAEFSAFSGWQLASNAIVISPFVDVKAEEFKDEELQNLHKLVKQTPDSVYINNGVTWYMWDKTRPLKQYHQYYMQRYQLPYLRAYIQCGGDVFRKYGQHIVYKHPLAFMRHYYLPNMDMIFNMPDADIFGTHMIYQATGQGWFTDMDGDKLKSAKNDVFLKYVEPTVIPSNKIRWCVFILAFGILVFLWIKKKNWNAHQKSTIIILTSFIFVTIGFLVFAAPVVYRYMLSVIYPIHFIVYIVCLELLKPRVKANVVKVV